MTETGCQQKKHKIILTGKNKHKMMLTVKKHKIRLTEIKHGMTLGGGGGGGSQDDNRGKPQDVNRENTC